MNNNLAKKELRKEILKKRNEINTEDKKTWDNIIFEKLINSPLYKKAENIFVFVSYSSEVDTHRFIEYALTDNKCISVPRVISKEAGMRIYKISSMDELESGHYGILEPKADCKEFYGDDLDLIIMPGAVFSPDGSRIGYGGGFYDRFLDGLEKQVPTLAIAYDFQVLPSIPTEEFDMKVQNIITN